MTAPPRLPDLRRWRLSPIALVCAGCAREANFMRPSGDGARMIADLTWFMIGLSVVVSLIVIALTAYAVLHRKQDVREFTPESDRRSIRWIVIGGAIVPGILLLGLFVATLLTLNALTPRPEAGGPLAIELIGRQWWWQVRYHNTEEPTARFESANEIHIPTGVRVPVQLTSVDVIHSFWVPELQGKIDLIPGKQTHTWLHAARPGVYPAKCAEYCGLQHTRMELLVIAHEPAEFDAWMARESAGAQVAASTVAAGPDTTGVQDVTAALDTTAAEHAVATAPPAGVRDTMPIVAGLRVFMDEGCGFCHAIRGTPARGNVAPDLTHVGSRRELAAGTLPNTRGHMAGWIANPQALKPGARMPRVPISPDDLHTVVDYLQSLR